MTITIYHNPRCSKSRQTLEILENRGVTPVIVDYLETPPTAARILELAGALGVPVADLLRTGESVYREATDLPAAPDDAALAAWIAAHPAALQRPIVIDDQGRAVLGRPPQNVEALL